MHAIMGCSTGAQLCRARIAGAHTLALAAVRLFALCQLDDEGRALVGEAAIGAAFTTGNQHTQKEAPTTCPL